MKRLLFSLMFAAILVPQFVFAQSYPFAVHEEVHTDVNCPFFTMEFNGEQLSRPCPKMYPDVEKVTLILCTYDVCQDAGSSCPKDELIFTAFNNQKFGDDDAWGQCVLAYSKASHSSDYCSVIQDRELEKICFEENGVALNSYWTIFYGAAFLPVLLALIFVIWKRPRWDVTVMYLLVGGSFSLLGTLYNQPWKFQRLTKEISWIEILFLMYPFVALILSSIFKKKWLNAILILLGVIVFLTFGILSFLPGT